MPTRDPPSPSSADDSWQSIEPEVIGGGRLPAPTGTGDTLIGANLLDTYRVVRLIAEGGMGRIYEAHHTRIKEKRYAVKVLRPESVGSAQIRARFEREMQAVARVSHPGVLAIVDVGRTALGSSFMVSEHLNGLDLLAYLKRFGALPSDRVVEMGCRIAEALEATHAQGIIHRDVKPSNVFLLGAFEPLGPEWDGVKLIDFGLSRFVNRDDELSKSGLVMGTPAYMAPEQARGSRTDHLTDVYGVGAVMYAAATGVPPFRGETQQQTLVAAMSREPVRPRELKPSITEALEIVIQRAMAKRPEERHPSMSALRLALSDLEHAAPRTRRRSEPNEREGRREAVRLRFVALASALLGLGLLLVANAVVGMTSLSPEELSLSPSEGVLASLALGGAVGLLLLGVLRASRGVWGNTAKLVDRLPRLRAPLVSALLVYGLGSLLLRFGHEVVPEAHLAAPHLGWPDVGWPGWSVLLSAAALLAAGGVIVHQRYWHPLSARQRWVFGPLVAACMLLCGLTLTRTGLLDRVMGRAPQSPLASDPPALGSAVGRLAPGAGPSAEVTVATAPDAGASHASVPLSPPDAGASRADAGTPPNPTPTPAPVPAMAAPVIPLAAPAPAADAPEPAPTPAPAPAREDVAIDGNGPDALRARAIAQSQRASGMLDAVSTLERLFSIAPERAHDPAVRSILLRAANMEGDASRAAFRVMSNGMGSRGPDLLYDLMLNQPALSERAKYQLTRHRVRRLFSPELSIAFDLRFTSTCNSRVFMLDRANDFGDQRSVDTLSALLGKPEKCGGPGALECLPRCSREAVQLARSIDVISRRIRANERAASTN
jgi:serine/threonine protein kinase